jgi:signal peptidase I
MRLKAAPGATARSRLVPKALSSLLDLLLWPYVWLVVMPRTLLSFEARKESMLPTILPGDRLLGLPREHLGPEPFRRGDLMVFRSWHQGEETALKRVIAVPGDEVEVRGHVVTVNGQPLAEPYAVPPTHGCLGPLRLAEGEYFVMGDNRSNSCDSRNHGPVTWDRVIARVLVRNGPLRRLRSFD